MKTWNELTPEQQVQIKEKLEVQILEDIAEIGPPFFDGEPDEAELQSAFDLAVRNTEQMRTPWFFTSYLWDHVCIREFITNVANATLVAPETYFLEQFERVFDIPVVA